MAPFAISLFKVLSDPPVAIPSSFPFPPYSLLQVFIADNNRPTAQPQSLYQACVCAWSVRAPPRYFLKLVELEWPFLKTPSLNLLTCFLESSKVVLGSWYFGVVLWWVCTWGMGQYLTTPDDRERVHKDTSTDQVWVLRNGNWPSKRPANTSSSSCSAVEACDKTASGGLGFRNDT